MAAIRPYRHGNLSAALVAAARQILDEGDLDDVGLRETSRRVGVSGAAAYRHFASKEHLLACVAAQGFRELGAAMRNAAAEGLAGTSALSRRGSAYVEFAAQNRGLFRLMFGSILLERRKYPRLDAAVDRTISTFRAGQGDAPATAALGLIHGLARLMIDGLVPASQACTIAEKILADPTHPWLGAPPSARRD